VGFGSGIERIILGLQEAGIEPLTLAQPEVMVAHFGGTTKSAAVQLAFRLRAAGIGARLAFARERRSLKSQMREANKYNVQTVLIVGEEELAQQMVVERPLNGGEQQSIPLDEVVSWLKDKTEIRD
jgi:histidyl-tRNA synthetase